MQTKPETEKLQKILAKAGFGGRRTMEEWISQGRVYVNDTLATLGDRAGPKDVIVVDGKKLARTEQKTRLILYHKPTGQICSYHDPEGRESVFDYLPPLNEGRWISIGRLDFNTSGLLLMTNDGELANKWMHPSANLEREYMVRIWGEASEEQLRRLTTEVLLDDGPAAFEKVIPVPSAGSNNWYQVILKEGRNREVRRLWATEDLKVNKLMRVRFGHVRLPRTLEVGQWMELDPNQD